MNRKEQTASRWRMSALVISLSALVLVTHDTTIAERMSRILHLEDGRIVGQR